MSISEKLQELVSRATMSDGRLAETQLDRPLLVPFSEDTRTVAIAAGVLSDALLSLESAKKALRWYADPKNYEKLEVPTNVKEDGGLMARVALARIDPT